MVFIVLFFIDKNFDFVGEFVHLLCLRNFLNKCRRQCMEFQWMSFVVLLKHVNQNDHFPLSLSGKPPRVFSPHNTAK